MTKARAIVAHSKKLNQKEDALRALLADIVESSSDAIFSRSMEGVITSWNAAATRIFGYRSWEIVGKSGGVLVPPDRMDEQAGFFEKIRKGKRVEDFETIRLRKDGESIAVSLTVSPIRDDHKRIVGASTIARDISMQRRLESELLKISERESSRIGQDLHDGLGQQLTGMELICRTLADSLTKRSLPQAVTAELLMREIRRAVDQTRALARGLSPVIDTPNGLMLALQDFVRQVSQSTELKCEFRCHKAIHIMDHSAALHLYRIAQEATSNAIRHGESSRIQISLRLIRSGLKLTIRDNGKGVAHDGGRRGMGLHIMLYRATMIGGSLRVNRAESGGTEVVCLIPIDSLNEKQH